MPAREHLTISVDRHGSAKILDQFFETVARFHVDESDEDEDILKTAREVLPKKYKGAVLSFDE